MPQVTANAIAWAQFRLNGGLARSLLVALGYSVIVVAAVIMIAAASRDDLHNVMSNTAHFLLGVQIFLCGVIGCLLILNSIQRDNTTKMIESHRLMPADPRLCVLGYAFGCAAPTLLFAAVNFLFGGLAASMANLPFSWWLYANFVVLSFCVLCWIIQAGAAMISSPMGLVAMGPIGLTLITGGAIGMGLPGMLPIVTPVLGKSVFITQNVAAEELIGIILSLVIQAGFAVVFVTVGARRFRSSDLPGFTGPLGLAMCFLYALSTVLALKVPNLLSRFGRFGAELDCSAMAYFSLSALLVFGMIALASHSIDLHRGDCPPRHPRGRAGFLVCGILLAFEIAAAALPVTDPFLHRLGTTLIVVLITCFAILLWSGMFARWRLNLAVMLVFFAVGSAGTPILSTFCTYTDPVRYHELTPTGQVLAQLSPFGALFSIWQIEMKIQPLALVLQAVLLIIPVTVDLLTKPRLQPAVEPAS
jgi:hypothetical protein